MRHPLFLSHDHRDEEIAGTLATVFARISLSQISVWFSSDKSRNGGILPGHIWLDEIRRRLKESKAVIALLTPHSISKPWLLFETGFGAAQQDCNVIPVCLGIDAMDSIPFPLAMYQCFQLADYESLKSLCSRLFDRYEIPFDEEIAKPFLERAIKKLVKKSRWQLATVSAKATPSLATVSMDIKEHLDRRLLAFYQQITSGKGRIPLEKDGRFAPYSVGIDLKFPHHKGLQYVEIQEGTSVQNVLDSIYFMLSSEVDAFTYLESWILREPKTNRFLVLREVGSDVPASALFKVGSLWEAAPLAKPYTAADSADYERWRK